MRAVDVIAKKRDGQALSYDEIHWFINAYTRGDDVADYQAAALLMAICTRGMTHNETVTLTLAMARSGVMLDLADLLPYAVDKHSSGGVGDKTSLVVLPLVAACGVPVAKMSGRGLGFSGGTLDKLEAFAGYRVDLTEDEFRAQVRDHGIVLAGQSADLAPADKKLYALRDVTATVPSLPLIVSSIMSKKIAAGANGIVLDVKVGRGAFMAELDDARALAYTMVEVGQLAGRDMIAVVSDMNQPLGFAVGNALEVRETIIALNGGGPADLREHCLHLGAQMLRLYGRGERWRSDEEARDALLKALNSRAGLAKLRDLVGAQGGDVRMVDDPDRLPRAMFTATVSAPDAGYISGVPADKIAAMAMELGAGRAKKGDAIDLAVGVVVHQKVGDKVNAGAPLLTIHASDQARLSRCLELSAEAVEISETPVLPFPLFYDTIDDARIRAQGGGGGG
jgi:pyrimidine-nucleoside phosphorylase